MKDKEIKVTLLGTGTSGGVPSLGCGCEVCRSSDPLDKRMRCAALIESNKARILIDCGPDIRMQLMPLPFKPLDAVLLTHVHYDHVAGIDDLRPFCVFGDINIYADEATERQLTRSMPYCFTKNLYPGVPRLNLHKIEPHKGFRIGDIDVLPIEIMHGKMPILGFRFGKFVYITDMKTINETEFRYLCGVETLVVNALRFKKEHHSHQLVKDAVEFSKAIGAKRTYLIHMNHQIGFHAQAYKFLPKNVELAYDGLTFYVCQ